MLNQITIELIIVDTSNKPKQIKSTVTNAIKAGRDMEECVAEVNKVLNFGPEQLGQIRKQIQLAYNHTP